MLTFHQNLYVVYWVYMIFLYTPLPSRGDSVSIGLDRSDALPSTILIYPIPLPSGPDSILPGQIASDRLLNSLIPFLRLYSSWSTHKVKVEMRIKMNSSTSSPSFGKAMLLMLVIQAIWLADFANSAVASDSLRSAISAVHRRQRDLASYYSRPAYVMGNGQPEDIGYGYQKSVAPSTVGVFDSGAVPSTQLGTHDGLDNQALDKLLMDYLEEQEGTRYGKRSVFRENSNYPETLQSLYEDKEEAISPFRERAGGKNRLRNAHALVRNYGGLDDRQRYEEDALDMLNSIWEKYRGEDPESADESDVKSLFEYMHPDERKRQNGYDGYDFFNSPLNWKRNDDYMALRREGAFDDRYRIPEKRYPIAKRSPSLSRPKPKKPIQPPTTDPKVEQDLSKIFSHENSTAKPSTQPTSSVATTLPPPHNHTDVPANKPLDIKKKSINWSDYFGMDRRKKSVRPAADETWLVDQYMKTYGLDKPKREDMDSKLRAMEDLIVDEAVKYTGSHEGSTDSREIQMVKDKVMAQLAAAYSLEKMRRALAEFRSSIAAQQSLAPPSHNLPPTPDKGAKEMKKPVPSAGSKDKPAKKDGSRDISNEINTNNYDDFSWEDESCPVLEDMEGRCSTASAVALDKDRVFLPICMLHQICYLCGAEMGAAGAGGTHGCDVTFLTEAASLCRGDVTCRHSAMNTLAAIRNIRHGRYRYTCDLNAHPCLAPFLER